MKNKLVEY